MAKAASSRFPPWQGLVIGLTALVLTAEPVGPGDEAILERVPWASRSGSSASSRSDSSRINLGQEAVAWALRSSPDQLFPEPVRLADAARRAFPPVRPLDRDVTHRFVTERGKGRR